jgi:hypothetical protein
LKISINNVGWNNSLRPLRQHDSKDLPHHLPFFDLAKLFHLKPYLEMHVAIKRCTRKMQKAPIGKNKSFWPTFSNESQLDGKMGGKHDVTTSSPKSAKRRREDFRA